MLSGAESVSHASAGMWTAHGVAAMATVIALCFGERALLALRETGRMIVSALRSPTVASSLPVDRVPRRAVGSPAVPRLVGRSLDAVGTRGPPSALRCA